MESISALLKAPERSSARSERAEIIKELYTLYTSEAERKLRTSENWKRYCAWLKAMNLENTPERVEAFKKTRAFLAEMPVSRFCYFLSHVKTGDLYYVASMCRDKHNRGESIGAYVMSMQLSTF